MAQERARVEGEKGEGRDPEIADFNPLAMWDTHYVRELDDSGYIDQLYR